MMPFAVAIWMCAAAVGGGLVVLRALHLLHAFTQAERLAVTFVIGTGVIGWLVFFPGWLGAFKPLSFAVILAVLTAGLIFLRTPPRPGADRTATSAAALSPLEWSIVLAMAAVLLMDFAEALAPAADADTMAYHFETPRRFLSEGTLYAIPRALDGVTQLLLQMTYGVAMGLGGKSAAPLWSMLSGWGLGALFYVFARRHMTRPWALAGTLCLLCTPAVLYSAGTGQVEARLASFALLGAYAAAMSCRHDTPPGRQISWAILAGLACGFFAGSKITGLIFAFVVFVSLAASRAPLRRMAVFAAAAAAAGVQWYVFNWAETGDPLFPLLWKYADLAPGFPWNENIAAELRRIWHAERPGPSTLGWFLMYPVRTIIAPLSTFESLRTGVGPAVLVLAPFAALAMFRTKSISLSPLFRLIVIAAMFYTIWYWLGPSLRVRHLLPVYPLVLMGALAGTAHYLAPRPLTARAVGIGFAALLAVQIAGQAVFSKKFVDYLASDTSEAAFLDANISGYNVVRWLNGHLGSGNKVLISHREWLYLLDVPYFYVNPAGQDVISLYPDATDLRRFTAQLAAQDITHVALSEGAYDGQDTITLGRFLKALAPSGCVRRIEALRTTAISSRTIPQLGRLEQTFLIFAVSPHACPIN